MSWFRGQNGRKFAGGIGVLISLTGLVFAYLNLAHSAGYWPFNGSSATESISSGIEMESPQDGFQFSGDFVVELSGSPPGSDTIWLVARNAEQSWYPLAEATALSRDRWTSVIRAEQVTFPVLLCAVVVDEKGAGDFRSFLRGGHFAKGIAELPSGAESVACRSIRPAR